MYRLLSPIINASIYATVPAHNRWSISTQLLFTRLSQPTAAPQAPNRRDGEIALSLGVGVGRYLWEIHSGSFVNWQLLQFHCGVAHCECKRRSGRLNRSCDCSFVLLESVMWKEITWRRARGDKHQAHDFRVHPPWIILILFRSFWACTQFKVITQAHSWVDYWDIWSCFYVQISLIV